MKTIKKIMILVYIVLFGFLVLKVNIFASDDKPIYYEEEILETNEVAGGLSHKRVSAFSQVTDPTTVEKNAIDAGLGGTKKLEFNKYYSQQLNILEIPNESDVKLVPWATFDNGMWSLTKVTEMAADYETSHPGWKVVAAINGDFFDISAGYPLRYTPLGGMKVNNEQYKVNTDWPLLGINNYNEGSKLNGFVAGEVTQSSNPYLYIYDENDNIIKEFEINKINSDPVNDEIALYIAFFDNNHSPMIQEVENAYIVSKAEDTVAFSDRSIYGKGLISSYGNSKIKNNQFAIKTTNNEVLKYLKENIKIKVEHKIFNDVLQNCDSIIGYHDNVLVNNEPCYENDGYGKTRMPRTLLGTKEDGSIVMVVCDGRQPSKGFYGITNQETSAIAKYYGMVNCYQMDGGGSATMVILKDGQLQVVNSPSDEGGARKDGNCILVTMRVPIIDYQVTKTGNSIDFSINVIEQLDKYKDLYIDLNGVKKQIVNGKVIFDNLNSNTVYVYKFYALINNEYVSIAYQGVETTAKQLPTIEKLIIHIDREGKSDRYRIECIFNDPDKALSYSILKIENDKYWESKGNFYYSLDKINLLNTKNWSIELNYNLQDNNGMVRVDINDCLICFESIESSLEAQLEATKNVMLEIFTD